MDSQPPEPTADQPPVAGAEPERTASPAPVAGAGHADWECLGATRVIATPEDGSDSDSSASAPTSSISAPEKKQRLSSPFGDFRLLRKLGKGAMATVYQARQLSFQRDVALKILYRHIAGNPKLVERFHREARIMGRLDHPNIVQGYEVGEHGGRHYFAMEYVDGDNLSRWLTGLGRLSVGDAVHIVMACARALEYAHGLDLVHRDVKPDNVLLTSTGVVKVTDLGMVKLRDEDLSLTQTGHALGTPWYMPLEQMRNAKDIDGRCDIYALGCMFYHLLTGRPPFCGPTIVDLIRQKEAGTFTPARQLTADVPERLDLIIAKMTAKHSRHRYQTCGELLKDLEALGLASPELTFLAGPAAPPETAQDTSITTAPSEPTPPPATQPADLWYVRYKTPAGQIEEKQLSTVAVLKLIEEGHLGPTARASRQAQEGFRALATYREFEKAVLGQAAKRGADEQATRYRNMYKKIEALQEQRGPAEATAEPEDGNFAYWLGLSLKIGLPIAGLAALIYFLKLIAQAITA
jgi:serine/threonine-protein kinase